ncbi:MAG: hypothetical protein IID30_08565 [Planctomycetes bacterium]|nr:hypothetical protein [Planctomycetota bacterium]
MAIKIPEKLKKELEFIRNETLFLRGTWQAWKCLSLSDSTLGATLRNKCPVFSNLAANAMKREVVSNIGRLLDRTKSTRSLPHLLQSKLIHPDIDISHLSSELEQVVDQAKPLLTARDEAVAHSANNYSDPRPAPNFIDDVIISITVLVESIWLTLCDRHRAVQGNDFQIDLDALNSNE